MKASRLAFLLVVLLASAGCKGTLVAPPVDLPAELAAPVPAEQVQAGEDRFPVVIDGGWGYIDRSGEIVIEPRFDEAFDFSEGLARVREGSQRYGYINPDGEFVIEPRFLWAYDFVGGRARVVLPGAPRDLRSNSATPSNKHLKSFVDTEGNVIFGPVFSEARDFATTDRGVLAPVVRTQTKNYVPFGLRLLRFMTLRLQDSKPWEVVTSDGQSAFELGNMTEVLGYSEGHAPFAVWKGWAFGSQRWGYVDTQGRTVVEPQFQAANLFSEGLAAVALDDRFGYIDTTGTVVIPLQFERAGPFAQGLAPIRQAGLWGFVDQSGRTVIPVQYDLAFAFSGGLALVQQDERFGFVALDGTEQIAPRYDYAHSFENGLAYVREGAREGYIDTTGAFVWSQPATDRTR